MATLAAMTTTVAIKTQATTTAETVGQQAVQKVQQS